MRDKLLISLAVLFWFFGRVIILITFIAIFWGIVDEIQFIFSK